MLQSTRGPSRSKALLGRTPSGKARDYSGLVTIISFHIKYYFCLQHVCIIKHMLYIILIQKYPLGFFYTLFAHLLILVSIFICIPLIPLYFKTWVCIHFLSWKIKLTYWKLVGKHCLLSGCVSARVVFRYGGLVHLILFLFSTS